MMKSRFSYILLLLPCVIFTFAGCKFTESTSPVRVRLLTYNIYHGEDANGQSNMEAVAGIINSLRPDLVALQEVDKNTTRAKGLDLTAELARLTGMEGIFGKAMDFAGGGYGEAVLTRLPVIKSQNHPLPHTEGTEPRAALEVVVQLPGGEQIIFVGTHLDHLRSDQNRMMQAERINEIFRESRLPVILAGDLNAQPDSAVMDKLGQLWTASAPDNPEKTYPAKDPRIKIDYILFRPPARWRVIEARVIEEKIASDHRPFLVILELLPEK